MTFKPWWYAGRVNLARCQTTIRRSVESLSGLSTVLVSHQRNRRIRSAVQCFRHHTWKF